MNTIYAKFSDPQNAEKAGGALLDHGIRAEHISIVFPNGYVHDSKEPTGTEMENSAKTGISTTTTADAESGAAKGAGIGLAAGTLAALAAVFIPGVGIVLGGGAMALALGGLAGSTVAGAAAGGVTGYLKDQGVPEDQAVTYHKLVTSGGAMLTVTPTDETTDLGTIEAILRKYEGEVSQYPATRTVA